MSFRLRRRTHLQAYWTTWSCSFGVITTPLPDARCVKCVQASEARDLLPRLNLSEANLTFEQSTVNRHKATLRVEGQDRARRGKMGRAGACLLRRGVPGGSEGRSVPWTILAGTLRNAAEADPCSGLGLIFCPGENRVGRSCSSHQIQNTTWGRWGRCCVGV